MTLELVQVSRFKNHFDPEPRSYPLGTILKEIQTGRTTVSKGFDTPTGRIPSLSLEDATRRARGEDVRGMPPIPARVLTTVAKNIKAQLPAFTPSGTFPNRDALETPSGIVLHEFDNLNDVDYYLAELNQHPNIVAAWRTMSGNGIAAMTHVSPAPVDKVTYRAAYVAAAEWIYELLGIDTELDLSAANLKQLRALVFDPTLHPNYNALPFQWSTDDDDDGQPLIDDDLRTRVKSVFPKTALSDILDDADLPADVAAHLQQLRADSELGTWQPLNIPCLWTSHENDVPGIAKANKTSVLFNDDGGITIRCFKCAETKRYGKPNRTHLTPAPLEILPDDSPIFKADDEAHDISRGPAFRYFTREERALLVANGYSPDAGWTDGQPAYTTKYEHLTKYTSDVTMNGHPKYLEKGRIWLTDTESHTCPDCGNRAAVNIQRYHLRLHHYCNQCHREIQVGSWLELELNRKTQMHILSTPEHGTYVADDPRLEDVDICAPHRMLFINAALGTGKTFWFDQRVVTTLKENQKHPIIIASRTSQVRSKYEETSEDIRDIPEDYQHLMQPNWGAFCGQSTRDMHVVGKKGIITTPNSLPRVLDALAEEGIPSDSCFLCFDEVDFNMQLLLAPITKAQVPLVKRFIRAAVSENGCIVMGQTETLGGLEAAAAEFGIKEILGFYKDRPELRTPCEFHWIEGPKKCAKLTAAAWEQIAQRLSDNEKVYLFLKRRATARTLKYLAEQMGIDVLVWNRYTRGNPRLTDMLQTQTSPAQLTIFTPAVDVALNLYDENAHVFVLTDDNDRRGAGLDTTVQQALRVRNAASYHIYATRFDNALPIAPAQREDWETAGILDKLGTDEETPSSLIKHVSARQGFTELAGDQPDVYLMHHLRRIGLRPKCIQPTRLPAPATLDNLAEVNKNLREKEKEDVEKEALTLLQAGSVLHEKDMQFDIDQGHFQNETEPLAHELALTACHAVGFKPRTRRQKLKDARIAAAHETDEAHALTDSQFTAAVGFVENNLQASQHTTLARHWLQIHMPQLTALSEEDEHPLDTEAIHRKRKNTARLITVILRCIPHEPVPEDELQETLWNAVKPFWKRMKAGDFGSTIARQVHTILGGPAPRLLDWMLHWMPDNYPVVFQSQKDVYGKKHYQMLRHPAYEQLIACIEEKVRHTDAYADASEETIDMRLVPERTAADDILLAEKTHARWLRETGRTQKTIAEETGLSVRQVRDATTDISVPRPDKLAATKGKARALREQGYSYDEIARITKMGIVTVRKVAKEVKSPLIARRAKVQRLKKPTKRYPNGRSQREIAKQLNLSHKEVRAVWK